MTLYPFYVSGLVVLKYPFYVSGFVIALMMSLLHSGFMALEFPFAFGIHDDRMSLLHSGCMMIEMRLNICCVEDGSHLAMLEQSCSCVTKSVEKEG